MPVFQGRPRQKFVLDGLAAKFSRNVTSQHGEDGIIAKVFELLGASNPWCVEFGAWDGKHLSNTWNLIANHGWHGVLIEADTEKYAQLTQTHDGNHRVLTICQLVGTEGDNRLDELLRPTGIAAEFDLLSVDIDGNDYHVWETLQHYSPRVVVIEFNPTIPNHIVFIQDRDPAVSQGASLRALVELGKSKGYELASTTLTNGIFVRQDLFGKLGIEDNRIDRIHDIAHYESHLIQLYDGTLLIAGNDLLVWHGIRIKPADLQVLPAALRRPNSVMPPKTRATSPK